MAAKQMSATEEPAATASDETVVAPLELPVTLNNKELGTSTILTGANDSGLRPAAAPEPMAAAAAADEGGIAPLAAGDAVLHFDANGAEAGDAPADILGDVTEDATLPDANTMTRDGYVFSGWNTAADGSGTTYMAGDTFTFAATGTTTLYAVWMEEVITWEDGMVVSTVPPAGDAVEVTPPVYDTDGETVITPATYSPHQGQTITVNVYGPAPASAVATIDQGRGPQVHCGALHPGEHGLHGGARVRHHQHRSCPGRQRDCPVHRRQRRQEAGGRGRATSLAVPFTLPWPATLPSPMRATKSRTCLLPTTPSWTWTTTRAAALAAWPMRS